TAKSRRSLLAGALGGLGTLALSALGRPSATRAATGDPVLLGKGGVSGENETNLPTKITTLGASDGVVAFFAQKGGNGVGIQGAATYGVGVFGGSNDVGVFGQAAQGEGVVGQNNEVYPSTFPDNSHY